MDVIFVVFKLETVQINAVNSVSLPSKTITESVFNDISSKVKISLTSGRVSNMIVCISFSHASVILTDYIDLSLYSCIMCGIFDKDYKTFLTMTSMHTALIDD